MRACENAPAEALDSRPQIKIKLFTKKKKPGDQNFKPEA